MIMIVTGKKGVGKTWVTRKELAHSVLKNKRKVLIYDASIDPELSKYKTLDRAHVSMYAKSKKADIRRVVAVDKFKQELSIDEKKELLKEIVKNFHTGVLLLEDFNKYITSPTELQELLGTIVANRQKNLDIIIHFQSLRAVTTRLFQNTFCFRLHKDLEPPDTFKERLADKFEMFKIATLIVDNEYLKDNKRFYLYVITDDYKIQGATTEQFAEACIKYLSAYPATLKRIKAENALKTDKEAVSFFIADREKLYLR
jgi:hypothetical protein